MEVKTKIEPIPEREINVLIAPTVSLYSLNVRGRPSIELRQIISDPDQIITIVNSAFEDAGIVIRPRIKDRLRALATLQKNKIIEYNKEEGTYSFII